MMIPYILIVLCLLAFIHAIPSTPTQNVLLLILSSGHTLTCLEIQPKWTIRHTRLSQNQSLPQIFLSMSLWYFIAFISLLSVLCALGEPKPLFPRRRMGEDLINPWWTSKWLAFRDRLIVHCRSDIGSISCLMQTTFYIPVKQKE